MYDKELTSLWKFSKSHSTNKDWLNYYNVMKFYNVAVTIYVFNQFIAYKFLQIEPLQKHVYHFSYETVSLLTGLVEY